MANPTTIRHRRQYGFTLVEAMITLAIAAILFAWAVPSLQDFVTRNRMSTEVNYFVASLYLARSESVKRLRSARLCPTTDGTSCVNNSNWHQGWMVFADTNGNNLFDNGVDTVLQQNPALPSRFQVTGNRNVIAFQPNGQSAGSNGTFCFRDTGNVANTRRLCLSNDGRVRTEQLAVGATCSPCSSG